MTKKRETIENELDMVFSKYIRLRDTKPYGGNFGRCISCGRMVPFNQLDCGHYYSRYNLSTRWDEDNCNAECVICNRVDANHRDGYKQNLIKKIGQKRFDELSIRYRQVCKLMDFELEELLDNYKKKLKGIEKR